MNIADKVHSFFTSSMRIRFTLFFLVLSLLIGSCHSGNHSSPISRADITRFSDLLQLFPAQHPPYQLNEDSLQKRLPDSLALPGKVAYRFFPDSLIQSNFGKHSRVTFYPLGKMENDHLVYLVVKVASTEKQAGYIFLYSDKGKYLGKLLVAADEKTHPDAHTSCSIDKRMLITVDQQYAESSTHIVTRENVYAVTSGNTFTLVLTNASRPTNLSDIYNPIDTLPRHHKYSADYVNGKMSIVSIRDGKNGKTFRFFIHFYKEATNCSGELEGTGKYIKANEGKFTDDVGPCVIDFHFSNSAVTIQEVGGCGAYRGINCFFDGTFHKKTTLSKKAKKH